MITMDVVGFAAALAFAVSSLPQAVLTLRQGHTQGMTGGMITLWWVGSALMLIYSLDKTWVYILNYSCNLAMCSVFIYYMLWPRKYR